jgi:Tol biopolymer transport system component
VSLLLSWWLGIPLDANPSRRRNCRADQTRSNPKWGVFGISDVSRDDQRFVSYSTHAEANNTYSQQLGTFNAAQPDTPALSLDPDSRLNFSSNGIRFIPDGQAVAYAITDDKNVDNLWLQPLDGKPGRQITQFHSDSIFGFAWSPDQKKIQIPRGHVESDVILLRDSSK